MINPSCKKCGASVGEDFSFCPSCGARLSLGDRNLDDRSLDDRLLELLTKSEYLGAIKIAREQTGMGLKEAKDYVDNLAVKNNITASAGSSTGAIILVAAVAVVIAVLGAVFLLMQSS